MTGAPEGTLTELLVAGANGDEQARANAFARIYGELKRLAHRVRRGREPDTFTTTALVHEAYLKLAPSGRRWESRAHFFAVAATAMRQILVDEARRHLTQKRGGMANMPVTWDEAVVAAPIRPDNIVELDEALSRLAQLDQRRALVVEHRIFAGLTTEETAQLLGVATATVERDWRAARAWLATELQRVAE